jgi:hypothetical protein
MFLLFAFFVIVLMLNLLIAIMGDAYSKVKENELVEGLHERAKLIVEQERLFPWRQTYARYLHVAEPVVEDEAQMAWGGLGGRLKALRREVVDVKADVKAGQAEAKADMEEMKAGQAKLETDMADMKALLEKLVAQSLQNAA